MKNNITIDNKKIALTDEQVEKIREALGVEENKDGGFEIGDRYYCIADSGVKGMSDWDNGETDNFRLNTGNAFKTADERDKKLEWLEALARVKKFIREEGIDQNVSWNDDLMPKYSIGYNTVDKSIGTDKQFLFNNLNILGHFNLEGDAREVIRYCEKDLKTILNV